MIKRAYVFSLISLIFLSTLVLGAGISTGDTDDSNSENERKPTESRIVCEEKETLRERVKCRLENRAALKNYAYNVVEEACRDGRFKERCEALYERSAKCYNEDNPVIKKRCFLSEAGINFNSQGTFRAAPDEAKRNYVVLLLYELQERIEKMQEEGKITTEQATSLVTKIVEIKKMILAGDSREDIVVKMKEFKEEYRTVMAGVEK